MEDAGAGGRFAAALKGGDRRSIGQADTVTAQLVRRPKRFAELWACLRNPDPLVRLRAADALEKFSRVCPAAFSGHKPSLLANAFEDGSAGMRWHLLAITARLDLDRSEAMHLCRYLECCLRTDPSRIVKVTALQAASELRAAHPDTAERFEQLLLFARASPWPSLAARARKIGSRELGPTRPA